MQLPGLLSGLWPQAAAPAPFCPLENPGPGRHVCHHVDHLHVIFVSVFWGIFCHVVLQVSFVQVRKFAHFLQGKKPNY